MKNIFSRRSQRLNQLSILFTSALLTHSLLAEGYQDNSLREYNSIFSNAYYPPGQMIFPVDAPISNDSNAKTSVSRYEKLVSQAAPVQSNLPEAAPPSTSTTTPPAAPEFATQQNGASEPAQPNASADTPSTDDSNKSLYINFNNISMIEYIRFLSRTLNKNFTFDENDLQFNVTIISDEPMTFDNIMTALLQELLIHGLSLLEQGNNLIIHKNNKVNAISQVIADDIASDGVSSDIVTRVFRLNTADPEKVAAIIKPLTSEYALVEVLLGTNNLIITDLSFNVSQIAKLIKSVDAPNSGLVIGQYVVRTTSADTLIDMTQQIISPISQDQPFRMVPWGPSNSIFIVSTPFIVERTLSILQHIDQNQKSTKILDLHTMNFNEEPVEALPSPKLTINGVPFVPTEEELLERSKTQEPTPPAETNIQLPAQTPVSTRTTSRPVGGDNSEWELDEDGRWRLKIPGIKGQRPPIGSWLINNQGNWTFRSGAQQTPDESVGAPRGDWVLEPSGGWSYKLEEGESISVHRLSRPMQPTIDIPLGVRPKSQFSVYKLQYRSGDAIQRSLQLIAGSLMNSRDADPDLIDTLTSVQWLQTSNSLIFTGYRDALRKMYQLMRELDTPLRQVFIEMLVLETSIEDALEYSVTWGTRFAGDHWAGGEGFGQTGGTNLLSPLQGTLNLAGTNLGLGAAIPNNLFQTQGFNLGVVGQKIVNTALGIEYHSIGALVQALRFKNDTNVVLNPKILTEDSVPAEIFVGENLPFKTQSISNDIGNNITSNFQFRDVGTRFRVTPTLGNNDIITLDIAQEISAVIPTTSTGGNLNNQPEGPSTTKSTTTTRVHLPSGYFLVISGMMRDQVDQAAVQVPCLGAIPIVGAAFKDKAYGKRKRNQMIFIRPVIIETEEEIQNLTKHQQDVWEFKKEFPMKCDWVYETEEALDYLNLRRTPIVDTNPFKDDTDF